MLLKRSPNFLLLFFRIGVGSKYAFGSSKIVSYMSRNASSMSWRMRAPTPHVCVSFNFNRWISSSSFWMALSCSLGHSLIPIRFCMVSLKYCSLTGTLFLSTKFRFLVAKPYLFISSSVHWAKTDLIWADNFSATSFRLRCKSGRTCWIFVSSKKNLFNFPLTVL